MQLINLRDYEPTLRTNTLFVNLQRHDKLEYFTQMKRINTKRINGYNGRFILQPKDTRCIKQDKLDELIEFLNTIRKGNTTQRVIEILQRIKKENSALGMRCDKIEDFAKGTDTKSANLPQNPQSLHSHTANTRILEQDLSANPNAQAQTLESKQNTQIPIAQQGVNPKRSEIIFRLKNSKICKCVRKFERRRGILPRLPKRKSGGFCLFGVGGLGGNPFSFCDNKPKELESLRSENNTAQKKRYFACAQYDKGSEYDKEILRLERATHPLAPSAREGENPNNKKDSN